MISKDYVFICLFKFGDKMQRSKTSSKFKRTFVSASVAMAIASTMGIFAIPQAHALVAATHVYHNHMPNFWPYYDVNQYANTKVGDPIRYTYDGQVIRIKENPPAGYTYFNPSSGKVMPHDDFQAYYQHHAKQGAYKSWPIETAQSNSGRYPLSTTHVTMSGALVNNLQSFADLSIEGMGYDQGWANGWKSVQPNLKTQNGYPALDAIHFTGHHSMGPLVGPKYFLKDLIFQNVTLQQDYFLGNSFVSSKGYFPTELGFSERLIPTLKKIGVEWSVLGDVHYSRALKDYPYLDDLGIDTLVSPPNRADLQNTSDEGDWKALAMEHEQQTTYNKFPFATTPHWVQYVDPETGEVSRIAGIPVEQAGSWLEGWEGQVAPTAIMEYDNNSKRPQYFVIAHDGDNSSGRAGSGDTWLNSGNYTYAQSGVLGIGVNEYLAKYPIPADDVQHVQDGSWIDTRDSSADPTWYHWHIPMGVWKGQIADFNTAMGTDFKLPVNQDGTPFGHAVSMEFGYHYLERNFALLQAAQNYAETAEQIWLDSHPNYWSPKTDKERQVTYEGNQLNPYMFSFPVKGDENNDYKGGANPAELGWYFLIASIDSGFGYYDENTDDNVKPTLGFNQSLYFTEPYVNKHIAEDRTGPSMWWVQRYPYNPGSGNASKAEGWTHVYADNVFAIYTYAYDVSGIKDVKVKIRTHKDKRMSPTDIAPRVYDPASLGNIPNNDPSQVGEWVTYDTKVRDLTPDINGVPWQNNANSAVMNVVSAKKIGSTYYAYISDYRDQLIDYYMEATDEKGNVTRSEIQSVYVGAGKFKKVGGKIVEDVNGDIDGAHMFFTDDFNGFEDSLTIYAKPSNQSVADVNVQFKDQGTDSWKNKQMTMVKGDQNTYYKATVSYKREAGCADIKLTNFGEGNSYPSDNICLSSGVYTIDQDSGSVSQGKPSDLVARSTLYFKPSVSLSQACVHYRSLPAASDTGWTAVPGEKMVQQNGVWVKELTLADNAEGIEFLFNDCANQWFKTAAGGNFVVNEIDSYDINGTEISKHQDGPVGNLSPVAVVDPSTATVTLGDKLTINGANSYDKDGSIVSYKWSTGETTKSITVTPTATTTYTLVVTDDKGAQSSAVASVTVKTVNNLPPVAKIESTGLTITQGQSLTLDASGSTDKDGKIVSYKWNTGATTDSITVSPASDTTYYVTVTDDKGATDTASVNVTVIPVVDNHAPVVEIAADKTEIIEGASVTLTAKATDQDGDKLFYQWSNGSNAATITVSPKSTTTYSVTVSDGKPNGNTTVDQTIIVTPIQENDQDLPALYFAGTANSWKHDAMTYDSKSDEWTVDLVLDGKGDSNGAQRFKVTTTPNWNGDVYGTAGGNTLCKDQAACGDVVITEKGNYRLAVNDNNLTWYLTKLGNTAPVASFDVEVSGLTVKVKNTSTDADGDTLTYNWSFDDGTGATTADAEHTFAKAGTYNIILTASDGTDKHSVNKEVTVDVVVFERTLPNLFFAGTTNSWKHDEMTFDAQTGEYKITLELTGKGDSNGAQRFKVTTTPDWKGRVFGTAGGNKLCDNQASCADVVINQVGTYELAVNDRDLTWTLTPVSGANHAPVAKFSTSVAKLSVAFNNLSTDQDGDAMTYAWDFDDGEVSDEVSPSHTFKNPGTYNVTLKASDGEKTGTVTQSVVVTDKYIPATRSSMYFAGTANSWGHSAMDYNTATGNWTITLNLDGKGDNNGGQRFKVTSDANWKGTVWGNAGDHKLCSNEASCPDIAISEVGSYTLNVNDANLTWELVPNNK